MPGQLHLVQLTEHQANLLSSLGLLALALESELVLQLP